MKKILLSLATIGIVSALVLGLSGAFFSDTETSTGNILQAGELDLKIDNESYLNGVLQDGLEGTVDTTWELDDLTDKLFFNFTDIKPSDLGEDTISIHAENNYWACMNITMTNNDDNTCNEPELLDDPNCTQPGAGQGELAENLNFVFWIDDGDNVLEVGENVFKEGTALSLFNGAVWPLQDALTNLFEPTGPVLGTKTYYIGKAWCFGTLSQTPLSQDGFGTDSSQSPAINGGVTCEGSALDNATQTDIVKGNIQFSAEQSRNNLDFTCTPPTPTPTPNPGERFVDTVPAVDGTFGHCCDAGNLSSDPSVAATSITGAPDSPPNANFIQISSGSTITAKFADNQAIDGPGNDIRVHIYDALYPATANIQIGQGPNCATTTYVDFGNHPDTFPVDLDLSGSGLASAQCIKLTDLGVPDITFPTLGFDLDAIEALNSLIYP